MSRMVILIKTKEMNTMGENSWWNMNLKLYLNLTI